MGQIIRLQDSKQRGDHKKKGKDDRYREHIPGLLSSFEVQSLGNGCLLIEFGYIKILRAKNIKASEKRIKQAFAGTGPKEDSRKRGDIFISGRKREHKKQALTIIQIYIDRN